MTGGGGSLPVVLVPVGVDDAALDACLAALDAATPAETRVWLIDDAQAGPRGVEIVQRWLRSTPLRADYTRRPRMAGEVRHLDEALRACGDADVAVLAGDALPAPGWLPQLAACFARDASIGSATPWCNAGESAGWPRVDPQSPPDDLASLAHAAATLPPVHPELPAAVEHAVLLRGSARAKAGGLDAASYASWYAALTDLSLRMSGLGWRNALCETAFVARAREGVPAEGDMDALAVRWPDWNARIAGFLMDDPLRELRDELGRRLQARDGDAPQRQLFPPPPAGEGAEGG
jgi:hypothetical protein